MTLQERINAAKFTGLTVYPTQGGRWQASMRRAGCDGWQVVTADTPGEALDVLLPDTKPRIEDMF